MKLLIAFLLAASCFIECGDEKEKTAAYDKIASQLQAACDQCRAPSSWIMMDLDRYSGLFKNDTIFPPCDSCWWIVVFGEDGSYGYERKDGMHNTCDAIKISIKTSSRDSVKLDSIRIDGMRQL